MYLVLLRRTLNKISDANKRLFLVAYFDDTVEPESPITGVNDICTAGASEMNDSSTYGDDVVSASVKTVVTSYVEPESAITGVNEISTAGASEMNESSTYGDDVVSASVKTVVTSNADVTATSVAVPIASELVISSTSESLKISPLKRQLESVKIKGGKFS